MTELKTLKEIEFMLNPPQIVNDDCSDEFKFVNSGNLRQEAIKWIKEHNNPQKRYRESYDAEMTERERLCVSRWIKYFYNITEEDLK